MRDRARRIADQCWGIFRLGHFCTTPLPAKRPPGDPVLEKPIIAELEAVRREALEEAAKSMREMVEHWRALEVTYKAGMGNISLAYEERRAFRDHSLIALHERESYESAEARIRALASETK